MKHVHTQKCCADSALCAVSLRVSHDRYRLHPAIYYTLTCRVRVKKVVGGDSAADTLESGDANNIPLTLGETGVHCFHVAYSSKRRRNVCETSKQPKQECFIGEECRYVISVSIKYFLV